MKDFKNSGFTAKFLPVSSVPENPFLDKDLIKEPKKEETEQEKEFAKNIRFDVYIRSKKLYNFRSKQIDHLSKEIAKILKKRYENLESIYPDFKEAYDRL